jgi:hypothetical protein
MKIKNFFKAAAITLFMALSIPVITHAAVANTVTTTDPGEDKNKEVLAKIVSRVAEIQNMDKSNLSPSEKKALRKELKEMKATADGLNSRVYISVGAIIIAILLLILILR